MKLLITLGLLVLASASPQRRQRQRQGRQDYLAPALDEAYGAPSELDEAYGAPAEAADEGYGAPEEVEALASDLDNSYLAPEAADEPLEVYGEEEELEGYGLEAAASDEGVDMGLKMLMTSVPGVPGEDYPIYAETPETAFSCSGQLPGGYYADEEAECQVFHVCGAAEAKHSFLCPNGTIFNQAYFICDWWFNVDCAESAALAEAANGELAATRDAASEAAAAREAEASDVEESYAAPEAADEGYGAPEELAGYSRRRL